MVPEVNHRVTGQQHAIHLWSNVVLCVGGRASQSYRPRSLAPVEEEGLMTVGPIVCYSKAGVTFNRGSGLELMAEGTVS